MAIPWQRAPHRLPTSEEQRGKLVEAAGIEGAARCGPTWPWIALRGPVASEEQRSEARLVTLHGPAQPQMGLAPVQTCPTRGLATLGLVAPTIRSVVHFIRSGDHLCPPSEVHASKMPPSAT